MRGPATWSGARTTERQMTDTDRANAMAVSVAKAARRIGVPEASLDVLSRAHALAMASRLERLDDDHHPAYLHPGRSVLILIRDASVDDALTLCGAAVLETRDAELRIDHATLERLGDAVVALVASVPHPGDERLAERLVTLPHAARMAALSERLDHLRHEHLREEDAVGITSGWPELHAEVGAVWLPVAERSDPRLAQRYAHWHRTFAKRLSREGR